MNSYLLKYLGTTCLTIMLTFGDSYSQTIGNASLQILDGKLDNPESVIHVKYFQGKDSLKEDCKILSRFSNLEVLEVSCKNGEQLPSEIYSLKSLKKLYIHSFGGELQVSEEISNLKQLELLFIEGVEFKGALNVKLLKNLAEVSMSRCKFGDGNQMQLNSSLSILRITHSNLTNIPDFVYTLGSIKKLDLGHNKIEIIDDELAKMKSLEELILLDNKIEILPKCIFMIDSLKSINISGNNLKTIAYPNPNNTKIKVIKLHSNPITSDKESLSKIPKNIEVISEWR